MTQKIAVVLSTILLLGLFGGCTPSEPVKSGAESAAAQSAAAPSTVATNASAPSTAPAQSQAVSEVVITNSKTGSVKSAGILTIEVDYYVGRIIVVPGDNDEISYEEVTASTDVSTFSSIKTTGNRVSISQGVIKDLSGGNIALTLRIPVDFAGDLDIQGDISKVMINDTFSLAVLDVSVDVGSIHVSGINAKKYDLDIDTGEILLTLPAGLAFSYDVSTEVGVVNSDFFDTKVGTKNIAGKMLNGVVGDPPTAVVELKTDIGDISVIKSK